MIDMYKFVIVAGQFAVDIDLEHELCHKHFAFCILQYELFYILFIY